MAEMLIHIGFRKAASTFMRDWFCFHPELSYKSGTGGFDLSEICKYNFHEKRTKYFVLSDAFAMYKGNTPPKTAENLKKQQLKTCSLLKELFPAAKILAITRSPETCMASEYSEYIKNGGTHSFDSRKNSEAAFGYFTGYYDYNFVISLYCNAFGRKNVVLLPVELLEENPSLFIKTMEEALGLQHAEFPWHKRNKSLSEAELHVMRKFSLFVYTCTRLFGNKSDMLFNKYTNYLEKKSHTDKRFYCLIRILSFFMRSIALEMSTPGNIEMQMKKNSSILKEYPVFGKYIHRYCLQ